MVGASDEAAGIRDLIQVYAGRPCLNLARLHVAALATSSLHCVGRQSAAPSDTHGGTERTCHIGMALALLSPHVPVRGPIPDLLPLLLETSNRRAHRHWRVASTRAPRCAANPRAARGKGPGGSTCSMTLWKALLTCVLRLPQLCSL